MSTEPASPADESLAIYDAVQPANQPATASSGPAPASRQALASERSLTDKPPSMGVTMGLLAVLVVASLVLLVAGLALVQDPTAPEGVPMVAISLGGSLLVWHLRALITGSGRRTALIGPWAWMDLVVVAAFGVTLGFSLFDLLTGVGDAPRIALLVGGVVGILAALVTYVRDADIRERILNAPLPAPAEPEPEPEPEPVVFFDPTGEADSLRPRGTWPLPRRGSRADASLWDEPLHEEPDFDEGPPTLSARRGLI